MFILKARARRVSILIIALQFIGLASCSRPAGNNSDPTPVLSDHPSTTFPMPPISIEGSTDLGWILADGQRVGLSDQRGKVLVLDLYATWCQPCRKSIPHLMSLHERYKEKGLALVGLNVGGPDDRVKVAGFAAELHITYPLGFPDQSLSDLLLAGDVTIPQTFVFGRDGRLVKRYIGFDDSIPGQLERLIQTELAVNSQ